jgi:hypothetical protein
MNEAADILSTIRDAVERLRAMSADVTDIELELAETIDELDPNALEFFSRMRELEREAHELVIRATDLFDYAAVRFAAPTTLQASRVPTPAPPQQRRWRFTDLILRWFQPGFITRGRHLLPSTRG